MLYSTINFDIVILIIYKTYICNQSFRLEAGIVNKINVKYNESVEMNKKKYNMIQRPDRLQ